MRDLTPLTTGAAGATAPIWMTWLDPANQIVVSLLGIAVLAMTLRNKWLDGKIKSAELRKIEDGDDG